MEKRSALTKVLAVAGTILVWFPLVAPLVFSGASFSRSGRFRFDYLMPAELFPCALLGGGLLLWAALRSHSYRAVIGAGLGAAVALLVGGQAIAVATGLASGKTPPAGPWWVLVVASLILYVLAVGTVGVGGILLWRRLYRSSPSPSNAV